MAVAIVTGPAPRASAQARPPALSPVKSPPAPTPVAVGLAVKLSLSEAVALGLRDNRTLRSAYLARVAEKFDLVVAESRFLPRLVVAGGVSTSRAGGLETTSSTLAPTGSWLTPTGAAVELAYSRVESRSNGLRSGAETSSLVVTQPLLRGAGIDVNMAPVRIARLQEQINRLALKATVSDTVTTIVLAYRSLLQAQEQLRLAQASMQRSRDLLTTNQALIEAGRMAAADIVQTQSEVANQQVAVLQAEQARNSAQLGLLRLLAVDLRTNVEAADPVTAEHVTIPLDTVLALAMDNRTDLLAQRKALEQDRQSLLVAKNNRLWSVDVVGAIDHGRDIGPQSGLPGLTRPGTSGTVGLQLSIPFGDYTLRQGEIQATTSVRIAEVALEDLKQQIEGQVRDAIQGVELNWRQLEAARQARGFAAQALDLQRQKLQAGRASNFEVLSFEATLRSAETQELSAAIAYQNALTTLDAQLGTTTDTWRIELNP